MPHDETPGIGHNSPPEITPFEKASNVISGLYEEAEGWLDGEPIDNQGVADGVSELLNLLRDAKKRADDARKTEAKPFDDGKKEVQARYKPLLDKADRAADVCKKALVPWLQKLEEEKRAKEAAAREEAERLRKEAEEAIAMADPDNLAARADAESRINDAKEAEKVVARAAKDKANASGGVGRAVTLRTFYRGEITDATAVAKHYWLTNRAEVVAFFQTLVDADVRANRPVPGVTVRTEKKAA